MSTGIILLCMGLGFLMITPLSRMFTEKTEHWTGVAERIEGKGPVIPNPDSKRYNERAGKNKCST